MIGKTVAHYTIIGKIGQGGMGEVYRATDNRLHRDVALKVLPESLARDRDRLERFKREAQVLASLNHPNIGAIYGLEESGASLVLVLELIEGDTLKEVIARGPVPVADAMGIILQIAEALRAAHQRDIVHRDLKPANVLVTDAGRAKLVDFGLAEVRALDADLTRRYATAGTPAYMAPEQVAGSAPELSSDIFSFGVIAYELLSGRHPFSRGSTGSVCAALPGASCPPLGTQRAGLPAGLEELVDRCLQSRPQARFANALGLSDALKLIASPTPTRGWDEASTLLGSAPIFTPSLQQSIQFCTTEDGVRLAYSVVGAGPPLVRVLGHFTHLEMEWEWPDLRAFWEALAQRQTLVRYDGRGIGLSDPYQGGFTEESRQLDLDAVLNTIGADKVILFGVSEGGWTAATYAIHHPERVTHLILFGAYARGASARPGYDPEEDRALMTLIRKGWGRDTPGFRHIFTSQFFPSDAPPGLVAHFNEMQRVSADPETAARYEESCHRRGDGRDLFRQVRTPTLVLHCRDDKVVGSEEGRLLASLIPGARLAQLPSGSHYFPTNREILGKVVETIDHFLSTPPGR